MPIGQETFETGELPSKQPILPKAVEVYARKTLSKCKLCSNPNRADYEKNWFNRTTTLKEVAKETGMSEDKVSEHMNLHVKFEVQHKVASDYTDELAELVVDKIGILRKHTLKLNTRLTDLLNEPRDPKWEQSIKAISSELRNYIRTLAQLEGELQQAPVIKLQQINVEYNTLKQLILTKLCPRCKKLLFKTLPEVEQEVFP